MMTAEEKNRTGSLKSIGIAIPSLNPDENLPALVEQLLRKCVCPIIIVDDGSSSVCRPLFDELSRRKNVTVLRHAVNCGKGRGLKTAFNAFLCQYPEGIGVVTADADGQHTPEDICRCVQALAEHSGQLVLGCRAFSGKDVPWKSSFGNRLTRVIFSIFMLRHLSDTQTGLRGIPRDFMKTLLTLPGERFEFETAMLCSAVHQKISVLQIPIRTVYVNSNRATHFQPLRDSLRIYRVLFGCIFRQFICFAFSGLFSALVDVSLFAFFFHVLLGALADLSRLRLAAALILARCLSLILNYTLNRNLVFHSQQSKIKSFLQYILLCGIVLGNAFVFTRLGQRLLPAVEITWIKGTVDLLLFGFSFAIQKSIIFRSGKKME